MYIGLRPMTSDVEDQTIRPAMLASDSRPTKPAASSASMSEKKSWIIGAACSRMPMPAVTLENSTTHSNQNCGVRIAVAAVDVRGGLQLARLGLGRRLPALGDPVVGRDAHREGAEQHDDEVADRPSVRKDGTIASAGLDAKVSSSLFDSGEAISAPPPKPMIASPVARPGAVREPLDQRRDRRDVADAEADAAEEPVAEVDEPQLAGGDAERGDQEAAGPEDRRGEHRLARPVALDPGPAEGGREPEHHDRDAEDDPDGGQARCRTSPPAGS